jgi:hypothetical protein
VNSFARDLEILKVWTAESPKESSDIERAMFEAASDPPSVRIERDEGRFYLYLGAKLDSGKGSSVRVVGRSDIKAVAEPFLAPTHEFDAVLLVTEDGEVIAQESPLGLSLARVDSVIDSPRNAPAAKDRSGPPALFDPLGKFSNMTPVTIGEADYKLYMQTVPLSLLSAPPMNQAVDRTRHAAQWVLCGLVSADRFRTESAALSYTTLLWFSGALAAIALAIPFVKLRALRPYERLRASDAGWVMATTFVATGLLTLGVLDVYVFRYQFGRTVDNRLNNVAKQIKTHLYDEFDRIDQQGRTFESLVADKYKPFPKRLGEKGRVRQIFTQGGDSRCDPMDACEMKVAQRLPPVSQLSTGHLER